MLALELGSAETHSPTHSTFGGPSTWVCACVVHRAGCSAKNREARAWQGVPGAAGLHRGLCLLHYSYHCLFVDQERVKGGLCRASTSLVCWIARLQAPCSSGQRVCARVCLCVCSAPPTQFRLLCSCGGNKMVCLMVPTCLPRPRLHAGDPPGCVSPGASCMHLLHIHIHTRPWGV